MAECGFCSKVRAKVKSTANNVLQKTLFSVNLRNKGLPDYFNKSTSGNKSGKIKK